MKAIRMQLHIETIKGSVQFVSYPTEQLGKLHIQCGLNVPPIFQFGSLFLDVEFFQLELQIKRDFQEQFVGTDFDVFVPVDIQLNNEV